MKQSIPFSYVAVEATALDGKPHSVQLYSDVTTVREYYSMLNSQGCFELTVFYYIEWLSGNKSHPANWTSKSTTKSIYHVVMLDQGQIVEEGVFEELIRSEEGVFARLLRGEAWDRDVTKTKRRSTLMMSRASGVWNPLEGGQEY